MARRGSELLPDSRRALIATYVALDDERRRRDPDQDTRDSSLRLELEALGVHFPGIPDPYEPLIQAAERADTPADIPRTQLAQAVMDVLTVSPRDGSRADLDPVLAVLADPRKRDAESLTRVYETLLMAGRARLGDGPAQPRDQENARDVLHPDVLLISVPWIKTEFRQVGDEPMSRLETWFSVDDAESIDFRTILRRALPPNWPTYNSFFCGMDPVDSLGAQVSTNDLAWRAVFHERVGDCSADWFPHTYLRFGWTRTETQLALTYELAQPPPGERGVLVIDEGYIQIDRLPGRYEVSTVKHVLFDDTVIPGGGVVLAEYAPKLGWLDQAVNWFSVAANSAMGATVGDNEHDDPWHTGQDAHLQEVLDGYEFDLREALHAADAQAKSALARVKEGTYGLDAYLADWAQATGRAIDLGARSMRRQVDFATQAARLAKVLTGGKGTTR